MRFRRLDLLAFGHFTDASLELQRQGDLHLVYGGNEAGKTTALRAIGELLYGMPVHTDLAFLHPMNRLRVGAVLEGADGETLEVVRRKGRLDTLRTPDDAPVPESALTRLMGGVTRPLFETMFGIHHDGLVAGGEELLRGEGEVGRSLYGAAVGAGRVHALLVELEREARDVYLPRGSRLLNQALADQEAARRRVRDLQLRPQQWHDLDRALAGARRRREELAARLVAADAELSRLRRLRAALPLLARREGLLERAAALSAAPDVPTAVADRHREAVRRLDTGEERDRESAEELAGIESALAALEVDDAVLGLAAEIGRLAHGRGRYEKDASDRESLGGRHAEEVARAGGLLRQVWPGMRAETADRELRPTAADRGRLEEAIARHPLLLDRREQAARAIGRVARRLEHGHGRLDELGDPDDPAPLERALARLRGDARLQRPRADAARELAAAEREAALLLGQLGLAGSSVDAAAALVLPPRERVTMFHLELGAMEQEAGAIAERRAEVEAARAAHEVALRELDLTGRVPAMDELRAARARRQAGWDLVRATWLGGEDVAGPAAAYDAARPLDEAYSEAVAAADGVADALRDAGERVLQGAQARAGLEACDRDLRTLAGRQRRVDAARRSHQQRWVAEWAPAGVAPGTAEQMLGWLERHGRLVATANRIAALRDDAAATVAAAEGHLAVLRDALAAVGEPAPDGAALDDVTARADGAAAGLARRRQERTRLLTALDDLEAQRQEQRADLDAAEADLAAWTAGWEAALAPLRLPAETAPAAARAALQVLDEALATIDDANVVRRRRDGIRRDMDEYEAAVRRAAAAVAPDLVELPAPATVAELERRLAANHDREARRRERRQAREAVVARRERLAAALAQDRAAIDELMTRLGAASREELDGLVELAAERRAVAAEVVRCESELLQQGGGWTVERYAAEAAQTGPDLVAAELVAAEDAMAALRREHEDAVGAEAAARAAIGGLDGSAAAADAAAEAEGHRARALAEAARFVRLRVAHAVLNREIELYRERNQAPLLRHASEVFGEITLGRYGRLKVETDAKDRLVMVGVTTDGDERTVAQMSSGTRDQLFLALRLATLAVHFETNPPMPVVLDDILINFDDDRSLATLRVLARLARTTQVLLFTHHARLLDLARAALPAGAYAEHALPAPGAPDAASVAHTAA